MRTYTPDVWIIVKIHSPKHGTHHRVLAGWYGGYAGSDSWKMNSGITEIKDFGDRYEFAGESGSVYICYKTAERTSGYTRSILMYYEKEIENLNDGSYIKEVDVKDIPLKIQKF